MHHLTLIGGAFLLSADTDWWMLCVASADRAAGADWRHHGNVQLCTDGHRNGHGGNVWNNLPRSGEYPFPLTCVV